MRRRQERIVALLVLYQWDMVGGDWQTILDRVLAEAGVDPTAAYCAELLPGIAQHKPVLDNHVTRLAIDWRVERMAVIDRNILRLAAYEILYRPDVPVSAAINEAIELAKTFSTPEAARFINGILGQLAREQQAPAPPRM